MNNYQILLTLIIFNIIFYGIYRTTYQRVTPEGIPAEVDFMKEINAVIIEETVSDRTAYEKYDQKY